MRNPITWGGQAVFATVTIAARTFAAIASRILVLRGRPPGLHGGIKGSRRAHSHR